MRRSLCACVTLSALALAAQSQAEVGKPTGYLDVSYRETDFDNEFANLNSDTFAIGGSAAIAGDGVYSDGTWGVQADASVGWTEVGDEDSTDVNFGAHLFSRSQSGLIGAFAGFSSVDTDLGDAGGWAAGLEGLNFYDNVSLYGSLGYAQIDDLDSKGWGGSLELRYFLEPNFRFDLTASAITGDLLNEDGTVWTVGFGAEYQLPDPRYPISGFLAFNHNEFDTDIIDFSGNAVTIGLRWNWDTNLLSRDRSGPGLPGASRLVRTLGGF